MNKLFKFLLERKGTAALVLTIAVVLRLCYMAIDADPYFHTWGTTLYLQAPNGQKVPAVQFLATHIQVKGNLVCFYDLVRKQHACLTNPDMELIELQGRNDTPSNE